MFNLTDVFHRTYAKVILTDGLLSSCIR